MSGGALKSNQCVWILEDDPGCQFVYQEILDIRYQTKYFESLTCLGSALGDQQTQKPHLLIADLKVSDGNFVSFLNSELSTQLHVPFIVISSLDDLDVLRYCLNHGAIDFLTKPFKKSELIVKAERILQDFFVANEEDRESFLYNDTKLRKLKTLHPELSLLTSKESELLCLFLNTKKMTLDRDTIAHHLWPDSHVHPKTIDVHLHNLRKKLNNSGIKIHSRGTNKWILVLHDEGAVSLDQ